MFLEQFLHNEITANILKAADSYLIDLMVPGFNKDEIEVSAGGGYITITGKRKIKEDCRCIHMEFEHPLDFTRKLKTDEAMLDTEKISAELKNGILRITVPFKESIKNRKVLISDS